MPGRGAPDDRGGAMRFRDGCLLVAVALLGLLFAVAYIVSGAGEGGNRPLEGKPTIYHPQNEGRPSPPVAHQDEAAQADAGNGQGFQDLAAALGNVLPGWVWDDREGLIRRFLVVLPIVIVLLLGFLVRSGLLEDRRAKRGRLIPIIEEGGAFVRIINVGDGIARLEAFGCAEGRFDGDWRRLKDVRRLIFGGDGDPVRYRFDDTCIEAGKQFSIMLRYNDAYGGAWEAWRVFRMLPARHVTVEEDGEQPKGIIWRLQRSFPLLIVLLLLSTSSS